MGISWAEFTKTYWETLVGTDFFTWEILTPFGLVTYYVLFFIRQKTREVHLAGVTTNPTMRWMMQVAKNLTMTDLGWLRKGQIASLLVHDRAGQFCPAFKRILRNEGIQTLALPFQSPNLNAYAERWVRSVKEECLSNLIILGESMLRNALREYIQHYHGERTHQGLTAIPSQLQNYLGQAQPTRSSVANGSTAFSTSTTGGPFDFDGVFAPHVTRISEKPQEIFYLPELYTS
jgi:transposase InsO family protein